MGLSEDTQQALCGLRSVGRDHGRVPGVDLVEDDGAFEVPRDAAVVEFPGEPSITVRLNRDLEDTVTIEDVIDFEVPRCDTAALVEAILAGDARLRRDDGHRAGALRTLFVAPIVQLAPPFTDVLVVPVRGDTCYEQPVPYDPTGPGRWLSALPAEGL